MQLRDVLSIEQIAILKSITRKPRVFKSVNKIKDFIPPARDAGRCVPGGLPPSDLHISSMMLCIDHASVYGVRGGTSKMVVFERPKRKNHVSP